MPVTVTGNDVDLGTGVIIRVRELAGITGDLNKASKTHKSIYDAWRINGSFPSVVDFYTAVLAIAPATFDGLAANSIEYREEPGTDHMEFSIGYNSDPPESTLRWSFDTSGGTIKMTTSKATSRYAPSGRTAPDFKGAIGVKNTGKDAEPEGVDVVIPGLKLTAVYKWPKNTVDFAYMKRLAGLTGKTNNNPFYTFAQGELLFLGATGELVPNIPTEVTYNFLASSNATGLTIGDVLGIAKKGHEYLWVTFEASEDTSAKKLVQRPLGVYVERVYDEADYSTMDIGTS